MANATRDVAALYAREQWPAVVTSTDRTRQVRGFITAVTAEQFTVRSRNGAEETFPLGDVLEIFPAHDES